MRTFFLALAIILCFPAVSTAHKVNIFAYVDGDSIVTDSGYSRSRRVNGGTVKVFGPDGQELASGTTDAEGHLELPIPEEAKGGSMDLKLVLYAGEGHGAEWTVRASELGGTPEATAEPVITATETTAPANIDAEALAPLVQKAVDKALKRELAPVKSMLADLHDKGPGMSEIFGGIGWLVGLGGLFAYARSRRG
ncbi:hypothetical protein [Salidesulfovibrio brasiliensis]|uniref:hypothetical protein n=1 Tax=Salidesulfovibrio brasiliensis TaxID=221711 RepID=UPI0006D07BCE|nr:hypothetical protein [Salidesulfovibrio brasiliensis]